MSDKTDAIMRERLKAVIESGISDDAWKNIEKRIDDIKCAIEEDVHYRVKSELAEVLSCWVAELAGKAVSALLEGNESMMRQYLSCQEYGWNGRSGDHNAFPREIERQHPIIHGKLFEQGCVALRKSIVDAHKELLVNERILDLEDQVKSLVAQHNAAKADRDQMWERCRSYL